MLFSPLFSLLTDRQTKGKALRALPRGCPPRRWCQALRGSAGFSCTEHLWHLWPNGERSCPRGRFSSAGSQRARFLSPGFSGESDLPSACQGWRPWGLGGHCGSWEMLQSVRFKGIWPRLVGGVRTVCLVHSPLRSGF